MCRSSRSAGTASLAQLGGPGASRRPYVKIRGRWTYLYRAVDNEGNTVDFLLRAKRDVAASKAFFRRALQRQGQLPHKITLDGYQASHRGAAEALSEHPEGNQCKIRSSKYVTI
jgi:transposase-like protein